MDTCVLVPQTGLVSGFLEVFTIVYGLILGNGGFHSLLHVVGSAIGVACFFALVLKFLVPLIIGSILRVLIIIAYESKTYHAWREAVRMERDVTTGWSQAYRNIRWVPRSCFVYWGILPAHRE